MSSRSREDKLNRSRTPRPNGGVRTKNSVRPAHAIVDDNFARGVRAFCPHKTSDRIAVNRVHERRAAPRNPTETPRSRAGNRKGRAASCHRLTTVLGAMPTALASACPPAAGARFRSRIIGRGSWCEIPISHQRSSGARRSADPGHCIRQNATTCIFFSDLPSSPQGAESNG